MNQEKNTETRPSAGRPRRDRWVKVGFLAVAAAVVALVWWQQRKGPDWPGWEEDLDAALARAAAQNRRVLVFFMSSPPDDDTRRMEQTTLKKRENRQAIDNGRFIRVRLVLDTSLKGETASRYKVTTLPTLMILDARGTELNRRERFVGEIDFRKGFLDCTEVVRRRDPNRGRPRKSGGSRRAGPSGGERARSSP